MSPAGGRRAALEVLDPGLLTLVQDRGRPGWAHVGVGRSGAADAGALRAANRRVGNDDDAAGLEVLLGGLRVRAVGDVLVSVGGAVVDLRVDGRPVGPDLLLRDGAELLLGRPERGLRTYVAVGGGVAVDPVLGSRASDRLGGLGPAPLAAGDLLPVGAPAGALSTDGTGTGGMATAGTGTPGARPHVRPDEGPVVLRVEPGPHAHWFDPRWPGVLCAPEGYGVLPESDRVAVRLDGPPLARARGFVGRELAPVGLVPGAVQVPPDGRPVVFGVDHPVTGGYPVVAVLHAGDVDVLAQVRPGDAVQLVLRLAL
ncbi:biotin-dependent carboxyltransferase family protein [Cellulomonas sp. CW35]|uniref:biotin-dependent carboxyltransferase family protein n=1 Tax=Cellulomonas sp. CW35 TaxID=3458249 RepID=UPI0040341243